MYDIVPVPVNTRVLLPIPVKLLLNGYHKFGYGNPTGFTVCLFKLYIDKIFVDVSILL